MLNYCLYPFSLDDIKSHSCKHKKLLCTN